MKLKKRARRLHPGSTNVLTDRTGRDACVRVGQRTCLVYPVEVPPAAAGSHARAGSSPRGARPPGRGTCLYIAPDPADLKRTCKRTG